MAITHNLISTANNLSGFDPVADVPDGSAVGRSWLLWKLLEGLAAFDNNIKKITDSSPTPVFLRSGVGSNLQTEPSYNRNVAGDSIKFYMANDPGLTKSPQSAVIYEMKIVITNYGLCTIKVHHKIDGSTTYSPIADNVIVSGSSADPTQNLVYLPFSSTTTNKELIPKLIFWKSSNANLIMSIDKSDQSYKGYVVWYNPIFSGYRNNVGAITEGLTHRATVFTNANNGFTFIEGMTPHYYGNLSSLGSDLSPLNSGGSMPEGLFTFNSANNLIAGRLRFGIRKNSELKTVSNEIEGILLANATAAPYLAGQINKYNTKYYLHGNLMSDGRANHKVLFELGT